MPRRSRSREKSRRDEKGDKLRPDASLKQELAAVPEPKNQSQSQSQNNQVQVIDLEEEFPDEALTKAEVKRETKLEPREERRKEKKAKVKKEKRDNDDEAGGNRDARRRHQNQNQSRSRSNSRRRKHKHAAGQHQHPTRRREQSSSSSSSSSTESEGELYRRFKPYTKVQLVNLVRKAELNGMTGQVIHPSTSVSPCPPGCVLVRLETGREIAVKPPNLAPLRAFHVGPQVAKQSQERRLQQVLSQIQMNVDNVMERTMALRDGEGSGMLLDGQEGSVQGGIGHML